MFGVSGAALDAKTLHPVSAGFSAWAVNSNQLSQRGSKPALQGLGARMLCLGPRVRAVGRAWPLKPKPESPTEP